MKRDSQGFWNRLAVLVFLAGYFPPVLSAQDHHPERSSSYARGVSDARGDAGNHYFGIRVSGDEAGLKFRWISLVEQRSLEVLAVPASAPDRAGYRDGYNEESRKILHAKYGYDLLGRLEQAAKESLTQEEKGRQQARKEIAKGKFQLIEYGLPGENAGKYWEALGNRFGVEVESRGCMLTAEEAAFASGHNEVVKSAVNTKFKKDIFRELRGEFYPEAKNEPTPENRQGAEAARADIAKDTFRVYDYVTSPKWRTGYIRILREAGVEVLDIDKAAAEKGEDFCYGYDDVARGEIEARFGRYFFDRARGRAQRELEASK